jgi:hypothetical protein
MTDIITQDRPALDPRCRESRPERILVGDEEFERNDISAANYGESERTHNGRDKDGAPYIYFGKVKYRPKERLAKFILGTIKTNKPQPSKRKAK